MLSLVSISLLATAVSASLYGESNQNHTCQINNDYKVLSCSARADPSIVDSCCAETFGGLFLSTQFWNTYTGLESQDQLLPENSWTLHGLWPDFCNGSYTQYCDLDRQFDPAPSPNVTNFPRNGTIVPKYNGSSVSTFLPAFDKYDLMDYMNTYWINQGAPNADFWAHEFSKHGTCYSTFDVPCYGPNYVQHQEVIEFWETAIMYYRRLPTWNWLQTAGIVPSNTTTYSLSQIQGVLSNSYGAIPYIGCTGPRYNETAAGANSTDNGRTSIDEVWYYFHAFGRPQAGVTVPVDATTPTSSCAQAPGAIHYYAPSNGSVRTHTTGV